MQHLKVLITDDEPIARDILLAYISRMEHLAVAGTCKNSVEAYSFIQQTPVDILLLDINMPEISGMDLLRKLPAPPATILTTAYSEYAVESYELNVVDYLLKPFSFHRFAAAIQKATNQLQPQTPTSHTATGNTLFVKTDGKLVKVEIEDLILIEGVKDYVKLHTISRSMLVHSTMKHMEEQLSSFPGMLRVHKSYIINTQHLREIEGNILRLGTHDVVIGNTYKEQVLERLNRFRQL